LGVRRIKEFNLALLGKWCWRLLVEKESLWYRVLVARYGMRDGQVCAGGRDSSVWWRNVSTLRWEGWFHGNVSRVLGDGRNTLFWTDVWIGEVTLRDRFSRLYDLSLRKGESVASMRDLGWGVEGDAWRWRRRLFVWEEESVEELTLLLQNVSLQVHLEDKWKWKDDSSSVYTVRSAYNSIIAQDSVDYAEAIRSIWHKDVPLKVLLFVWRLFRDRLPTKNNLHRRQVLDIEEQYCAGGCGLIESSTHLFFQCFHFGSVWNHILRWIGVVSAMPIDVTGHFTQFQHLCGANKSRQSILQVIWYATVWEIWKERNNIIFNSIGSLIMQVVDRIKLLTFKWLKVKFPSLPFNYYGWWLSPFTLLGIG
jgi:hypothetical protein